MSTKNNPGAFRCFEAALPDEHVFTLLARDPAAPATLEFWAAERELCGKTSNPDDLDRIVDARRDADLMRRWRDENLDPMGDGSGPSWKLVKITDDDGGPIRLPDNVQYVAAEKDGSEAVRVSIDWLKGLTSQLVGGLISRESYASLIDLACGSPDRRERTVPVEVAAEDAAKRDDRTIGLLAAVNSAIKMIGDLPHQYKGGEVEAIRRTLIDGLPDMPVNLYQIIAQGLGIDETRLRQDFNNERPPVVDTEPHDLAHAPEVPPHRFSQFHKAGRYAYARGLEINPTHLPIALDAMAEDGWNLLSIFGATDSKHVGFIFERRPEMHVVHLSPPTLEAEDRERLLRFARRQPLGEVYRPSDGGRESAQSRQFLDGAPLDEIAAGKPLVAERFITSYVERVGPHECTLVQVPDETWPDWAIGCGPAGRGRGLEA